jgi:hypothetical protein
VSRAASHVGAFDDAFWCPLTIFLTIVVHEVGVASSQSLGPAHNCHLRGLA